MSMPFRRCSRLHVFLLLLLSWSAAVAFDVAVFAQMPQLPSRAESQETATGEDGEELTREIVEARRADVAAERRQVEEIIARRQENDEAEVTPRLVDRREQLQRVDRLLERQLEQFDRRTALDKEMAELEKDVGAGPESSVESSPPYGLSTYDRWLDERESQRASIVTLKAGLEDGQQSFELVERRLEEAERAARAAREKLEESAAEDADAPRRELEKAETELRLASEQWRLRRLELDNARQELEIARQRDAFYAAIVTWFESRLEPTAEELEAELQRLEDDKSQLEERLEKLAREIERAEQSWTSAEARVGAAPSAAEAAMVETRRLELELAQRRQDLLENRLDHLEILARRWPERHRLLRGEMKTEDLAELEDAVSAERNRIERAERLLDVQIEERRRQLTTLGDRLSTESRNGGTDEATRRWLRERRQKLEEFLVFQQEQLDHLRSARSFLERFLAELRDESDDVEWGERLSLTWRKTAAIWNHELTVVDDRPITVGKVVVALILLFFGYLAARRLAAFFERKLLRHLALDRGATAALRTLTFYLLLAVVVLYALDLVGIPLTVFTVLGGVLAIGIGFGSQNIVNNFISGLILMVERPIKVGDLVEVDGQRGTIERIGARSTRVRSGENTHIIVPNSSFLEKNVFNWTVADDRIRTHVDVGVAYGSPVDEVRERMLEAVGEHERILKQPRPEVLFMEFGDNALLFRVYFWLRLGVHLDRLRLQSEVRFAIDRHFATAGLVIAFPQRDVHIDGLGPLEVRMLGGGEEPETERPAAAGDGSANEKNEEI